MKDKEIIEVWKKHGVEALPSSIEMEVCKEIYQAGLQAGRKEVVESFETEVKHHSNPELRRQAFEKVLLLRREGVG